MATVFVVVVVSVFFFLMCLLSLCFNVFLM